jgi:hypothetical protein
MSSLRKLTLSIEQSVIERARRYSRRHGKSISQLVTQYLAQLDGANRGTVEGSPTVRRLRGILPPKAAAEEYRAHIERKHRL